jgi:glycosyltransferase involved in cell wall biosynthesis
MAARLRVLYVTQVPPSPPRYGAQVRIHGLMTALAERHEVSAVCCAGSEGEAERARAAMGGYCREVHIVVDPTSEATARKRLLQLHSLASRHSFERLLFTTARMQRRIDAVLSARRFDVVNVEGPFVVHHRFRTAPPGAPAPRVVLDEHNVEYDVSRQIAGRQDASPARRIYAAVNWRKMRREEERAWGRVDAITVTSPHDAGRVRAAHPAARVAVVPNAVDVERYAPRPDDPPPDRSTLLFFGALDYFPNSDALAFFLDHVWPRVLAAHPSTRLRILGRRPPAWLVARREPGVEIGGFVEDLRPSIAAAGAVIVPLRLGGGTRLKILEAMAMAKPIVSTELGAEGIDVAHGRELLLADGAEAFAAEIGRLLDAPALGIRLGRAARALVERRYSWRASAAVVDEVFQALTKDVAVRAGAAVPLPTAAALLTGGPPLHE